MKQNKLKRVNHYLFFMGGGTKFKNCGYRFTTRIYAS